MPEQYCAEHDIECDSFFQGTNKHAANISI
jgi:hypothetical protein